MTARKGRLARSRAADAVVRRVIALSGWLAIVILAAIFVFLAANSAKGLSAVGIWKMISGTDWFPTSQPPRFGFLPAEVGSLWVTGVALLLAVPVGIAASVFLSEFATGTVKELGKAVVEFMAAVPSVVLGLLGVAVPEQVRPVSVHPVGTVSVIEYDPGSRSLNACVPALPAVTMVNGERPEPEVVKPKLSTSPPVAVVDLWQEMQMTLELTDEPQTGSMPE